MVLYQYINIGTLGNLVCIHNLHVRKTEEINEAQTEDEEVPARLLVREEEDSVVQKVTEEKDVNTVPNQATAALATIWT